MFNQVKKCTKHGRPNQAERKQIIALNKQKKCMVNPNTVTLNTSGLITSLQVSKEKKEELLKRDPVAHRQGRK